MFDKAEITCVVKKYFVTNQVYLRIFAEIKKKLKKFVRN